MSVISVSKRFNTVLRTRTDDAFANDKQLLGHGTLKGERLYY